MSLGELKDKVVKLEKHVKQLQVKNSQLERKLTEYQSDNSQLNTKFNCMLNFMKEKFGFDYALIEKTKLNLDINIGAEVHESDCNGELDRSSAEWACIGEEEAEVGNTSESVSFSSSPAADEDSSNKQIQGQIRTGQTNNNTNGRTTSKCIYKYGHQGSGQSGGNVSKKSKCEYCGKIVHSSYLLNHKRIHIGKKPFVCGWENCGKSFALPNYLLIHKRSHTGRKPFVCDWRNCGKGFNGSTDLKIHKRSHTGEKPFICNWEECRKRFSAKRYLVCHKLTHTRKKTYKCDVQGCEIVFRRKR